MPGIRTLLVLSLGLSVSLGGGSKTSPSFEEILKIDMHSHIFDDVPEVVEMMDRNRLRMVNVCVRGYDPLRLRLAQEIAVGLQEKYGRHRFAGAGEMEYRSKRVQSLDLPREVLEKFFHGNALRVIPGLE